MANANVGGHFNEAFELEPSWNSFEKNVDTQGQHQDRNLKGKILKNLLLISVAFMVLFTSYESISKLQSSINKARLSLKCFSFILTCDHSSSISIIRHSRKTVLLHQVSLPKLLDNFCLT